MTGSAKKDFGGIREDYAFFQDNSTEALQDMASFCPRVQALAASLPNLDMLDFGCGSGNFTRPLLEKVGISRNRLKLSLVEPEPGYLQSSIQALQPFSAHPVCGWPNLPEGTRDRFDLILSNHALYYVPHLEQLVVALIQALKPGGILTTALAGHQNQLVRIWQLGFGLLHRSVPYNTAETLREILDRKQIAYETTPVQYRLEFPDSRENRHKILRFLLADHFNQMPQRELEDFFDPFAAGGRIQMDLVHEQFTFGR